MRCPVCRGCSSHLPNVLYHNRGPKGREFLWKDLSPFLLAECRSNGVESRNRTAAVAPRHGSGLPHHVPDALPFGLRSKSSPAVRPGRILTYEGVESNGERRTPNIEHRPNGNGKRYLPRAETRSRGERQRTMLTTATTETLATKNDPTGTDPSVNSGTASSSWHALRLRSGEPTQQRTTED